MEGKGSKMKECQNGSTVLGLFLLLKVWEKSLEVKTVHHLRWDFVRSCPQSSKPTVRFNVLKLCEMNIDSLFVWPSGYGRHALHERVWVRVP